MNGFLLDDRIIGEVGNNRHKIKGGFLVKKEMKKTLGIVLSAVTVLSIGATSVFAAGSRNGRNYTDTDGDGVCDNRVTASCVNSEKCPTASFVDEDNDGICDNRGIGKGQNAGQGNGSFVDDDNDGICDNRGTGRGQNAGQSNGNFVDEDNDGVCDNRGTGRGCCKGYCSK